MTSSLKLTLPPLFESALFIFEFQFSGVQSSMDSRNFWWSRILLSCLKIFEGKILKLVYNLEWYYQPEISAQCQGKIGSNHRDRPNHIEVKELPKVEGNPWKVEPQNSNSGGKLNFRDDVTNYFGKKSKQTALLHPGEPRSKSAVIVESLAVGEWWRLYHFQITTLHSTISNYGNYIEL